MTAKQKTPAKVHTEPVVTIESDLFDVVDIIKQLKTITGNRVDIQSATVVLHNYEWGSPVGTLTYTGPDDDEWNFEASND